MDKEEDISKAASELSKLGASKGGKARAEALTPQRRREIARAAVEARWNRMGIAPIPRATHDGTIEIGSLRLPCAVLEDGTRVLSVRGFAQVIGAPRGGAAYAIRRRAGGAELPVYFASQNLKPFIDSGLMAALSRPIAYVPLHGGRSALGLKAELLPRICEVWLRARDADALTARQQMIARRADILSRGLAHTAIIALVDEATGYQDLRARDALARILEKFIAEELRPWVKTFPLDFYRGIYRLRGWQWPPQANKHNSNLGRYTNDFIYDRLAPGVKAELHRITPRYESGRLKQKLFQRLSDDIGHPKLREHLGAVVMALKMSKTWDEFKKTMNAHLPKYKALPLFDDLEKKK